MTAQQPALSADVVVVGLGVGGEAVAEQLAGAGADVIGIEAELKGGECPYWGCIPTKMMLRAAGVLAETGRVPGLAGKVAGVEPDWSLVARRIRDEATDTWDDTAAVKRFTDTGGRFVRGRARILDRRRVDVPGTGVIDARRALVIGTGTTAAVPPIPGLADTPFWTNREAVEAETLPDSLVIVGGGAIGCELGQAFARFGTAVTIVESSNRVVPSEEPDASAVLADALEADGIALRLGAGAWKVEYADDAFAVHLDAETLRPQALLVATGRRPAVAADDWAALGLTGDPGYLPVDDRLRISAEGGGGSGHGEVYAVGDVTGKGEFTHLATYQADIVVREILGRHGPPADYRATPRVTFTDPEIGAVGLTEAQARDHGITVATGTAQIPSTSRGWIHKAGNAGAIKLVVDADTDLLVGALSAGPNGGEVLGALVVAVHARVTIAALESMIYAFPTFHRGILDAVRDLRVTP
jgi:pyruvate/2-oxoglutarate dehydrogenase complex dihydrolipoamide dehydrogenase (E3) component